MSASVVVSVQIVAEAELFSSISSLLRAISAGIALNSFCAPGVGIHVSDQSASVSVSATNNLQIGKSTAARSHPHAVSSHLTKSILFPLGSLSSSSSLGVFLRLKYCVHGRSISGVIHV